MLIVSLTVGNWAYFSQDKLITPQCSTDSGRYNQLNSMVFVLICFGYVQGSYYLTIWFSIVCMKCNGEDPLENRVESDGSEEVQEEEAVNNVSQE
jgi:hypothetical protein